MKKTIVMLIALATILASLAGCGSQPNSKESTTPADAMQNTIPTITEHEQPDVSVQPQLTTEHIATIPNEWKNLRYESGGVIFQASNGLLGIMSIDGQVIGEAMYVYCDGIEDIFQVATQQVDASDVDSYNRFGAVNAEGTELIPLQYAYIRGLNDRYYYVCEVTGTTENREEALLYGTDFVFEAYGKDPVKEGDILLKGQWYVYDMVAGRTVEGATGTKPYATRAYGNLLEYHTDAEERIVVNQENRRVPDEARLFKNGYYSVSDGQKSVIYDSDHKELVTLEVDAYILDNLISATSGEYIVARNPERKFVLLDFGGNPVSATFDDVIWNVHGQLLQLENEKLCTFSGTIVYEGDMQSVEMDEQWGNAWIVYERTEDGYVYTMIDQSGNVLCQAKYISKLVPHVTQADHTSWYYCMADQDFTLKGVAVAPWLIAGKEDKHDHTLIDAVSGKTLLHSYWGFNCIAIPGSVIYAYTTNADNALEIYRITR